VPLFCVFFLGFFVSIAFLLPIFSTFVEAFDGVYIVLEVLLLGGVFVDVGESFQLLNVLLSINCLEVDFVGVSNTKLVFCC